MLNAKARFSRAGAGVKVLRSPEDGVGNGLLWHIRLTCWMGEQEFGGTRHL